MDYIGKLYGKVAGRYIELELDSLSVDAKDKKIESLLYEQTRLINSIGQYLGDTRSKAALRALINAYEYHLIGI